MKIWDFSNHYYMLADC